MASTILMRPVKTEKSTKLAESNKFVFLVTPTATKGQIKETVQKAFGVLVLSVRTITIVGKKKKSGRKKLEYQLPSSKRAIVRIKEGQSIDLFDAQKKKGSKRAKK